MRGAQTRPRAGVHRPLNSLSHGALSSAYGTTLLTGLALCMLGDILLIPHHKMSFLGGIGAFLLGHVAFALAFFALIEEGGAQYLEGCCYAC